MTNENYVVTNQQCEPFPARTRCHGTTLNGHNISYLPESAKLVFDVIDDRRECPKQFVVRFFSCGLAAAAAAATENSTTNANQSRISLMRGTVCASLRVESHATDTQKHSNNVNYFFLYANEMVKNIFVEIENETID